MLSELLYQRLRQSDCYVGELERIYAFGSVKSELDKVSFLPEMRPLKELRMGLEQVKR